MVDLLLPICYVVFGLGKGVFETGHGEKFIGGVVENFIYTFLEILFEFGAEQHQVFVEYVLYRQVIFVLLSQHFDCLYVTEFGSCHEGGLAIAVQFDERGTKCQENSDGISAVGRHGHMERGVHLFVGNIHVKAILKQKLGALGGVFLVGSEFVAFPASFGSKNRIVKGCSSLGVRGLEHDTRTLHQKGDNFYQTKVACLRQGRSAK